LSFYRGDSLWQLQIGVYCTLVRSLPLSDPLDPLFAPLKVILGGVFFLFCRSIWSLPYTTINPHLNLLLHPSCITQHIYCNFFTSLSCIINIEIDDPRDF
jgi:hypothetical protein